MKIPKQIRINIESVSKKTIESMSHTEMLSALSFVKKKFYTEGNFFYHIRSDLNLKQVEFAALLRVRQGTVSKLESGVSRLDWPMIAQLRDRQGLDINRYLDEYLDRKIRNLPEYYMKDRKNYEKFQVFYKSYLKNS